MGAATRILRLLIAITKKKNTNFFLNNTIISIQKSEHKYILYIYYIYNIYIHHHNNNNNIYIYLLELDWQYRNQKEDTTSRLTVALL